MCGRYASYRAAQDLADELDVDEITDAARTLPPSYNVAPTQQVRIVLDRSGDAGPRRELHAARWGLVPAWAKDVKLGYKMINARVETLDDRPAFRTSLERRRCVVPADGYYEWQRRGGARTPFFVRGTAADRSLCLAGLYAFWRDPERADDDPDRWVLSTTIVTTAAPPDLARLHDRVPVVLDPAVVTEWLDPGPARTDRLLRLLTGSTPHLKFHEVSDRVNRTTEDDAGLIEPR